MLEQLEQEQERVNAEKMREQQEQQLKMQEEMMAADNQNMIDYSQMDPSIMMMMMQNGNDMDMSNMPLNPNEMNSDLANVFGSNNALLISQA